MRPANRQKSAGRLFPLPIIRESTSGACMEIQFRAFETRNSEPSSGEIQIRLHAPEHYDRRDYANLALQFGIEVFRRGSGKPEVVVVSADPTLDDLLAATFVIRLLEGQNIPEGAKAFANYAALVREGLK